MRKSCRNDPGHPSHHPHLFFPNSRSVTFFKPNLMQNYKKTNERSQRYLKTNHRWTDWHEQKFKILLPVNFLYFFLHTLAKFQDSSFTSQVFLLEMAIISRSERYSRSGHSREYPVWADFPDLADLFRERITRSRNSYKFLKIIPGFLQSAHSIYNRRIVFFYQIEH